MSITQGCPENKKRLECLGDLEITKLDFDEDPIGIIHNSEYIEKVRTYSAQSLPLGGKTGTSPGSFKATVYAVNATMLAAQTKGFASEKSYRLRSIMFLPHWKVGITNRYYPSAFTIFSMA